MITVVIATGLMNAGGAETLIMEMLRHRSEDVRYVLLIHYSGVFSKGIYDDEIKEMGIPIVYIPAVGAIGTRRYIRIFKERIASIGHLDILHSHLNAVGGIIAKAAKKAGIINRIIHCHADIKYTGSAHSILLNELKLQIMKIYVKRYGTDFWACSQAAGKRLFGHKAVKIIPNVIEVEKYLPGAQKTRDAKEKRGLSKCLVVGSIGRIAPIKNYELALQIIAKLKEIKNNVHFVCYGRIVDERYYAKLTAMANNLGISDNVHFFGNSTNIFEDIGAFDVFLMPSLSEGFGMAAIESQAAGIPTLVSEGVPRLIDAGIGLVSFLSFDADEWVDAIINSKLIKHPSNDDILCAFNKKGYNSPLAVQRIESAYCKMVESRSKQ